MIEGLKPYAEYKGSGLPYLGEVPVHWNVYKARQIGRLLKGSGGSKADNVAEGLPCVRHGQLYTQYHFLGGADRQRLDPILDACVAVYVNDLDEDEQVDFKSYDFLATILPYGVQEWEKLSIFLNFLVSKLPAPVEEDLAKGILESIDSDSFRGWLTETVFWMTYEE